MHKQIIALFLVSSLMTTMFLPAFIFLDYLSNQAAITEAFCENKAQPELKCNGQCHLAKQLKKVNPPSNEEEQAPPSVETFAFLWFQNETNQKSIFSFDSKSEQVAYLNAHWDSIQIEQPGPPPRKTIA